MPVTVRVEGVRKLRAALRRADLDLTDLRTAHLQASSTVASAAEGAAPRRTGRLAGTVRPGATKVAALVRAGFASVPYAGPVHWGWPAHGITAQPFVAEAAQRTEPVWTGEYLDHVQQILDRLAGSADGRGQ
jgi:hypothetical protein